MKPKQVLVAYLVGIVMTLFALQVVDAAQHKERPYAQHKEGPLTTLVHWILGTPVHPK